MTYCEIIPLQNIGRNIELLTYSSTIEIELGAIVEIEIGKKTAHGVVVNTTKKPSFQTKEISKKLDQKPIPAHLVEIARWIANYYGVSYGQTLKSMLPRGLGKSRRAKTTTHAHTQRINKLNLKLTPEQQSAIAAFNQSKSNVHLLQGVTGSGKTRVYIELVSEAISKGLSAIVMVPEIGLTQQLLSEFAMAIDPSKIVLTHSQLTESERHQLWRKVLDSEEPHLILGPRSALFSPLHNLGLIIMDEAHDSSYKQDQQPKYDATKVAARISKLLGCKLLLGTATPSVSERYQLEQLGSPILKLNSRIGKSKPPKSTIVSMQDVHEFKLNRHISDLAIQSIEHNLENHKQSMILINRRGTASSVSCQSCGWIKLCQNCDLPMTFHQNSSNLICHTCGTKSQIIHSCPNCTGTELTYKGAGTQKIESELTRLFPSAKIARIDRDSFDHKTLHQLHQSLYDADVDIIVGTQMISKGLDLPKLQTVIIANADGLFNLPDFSSGERAFQLIYQASGRSGREKSRGETIIQTYSPNQPIIRFAADTDYEKFYEHELNLRKKLKFPPFSYLMVIQASRKSPAAAESALKQLMANIRSRKDISAGLTFLGPAPKLHEKAGSNYHWQVIAKSKKRADLLALAKILPQNFFYTLDPISIL